MATIPCEEKNYSATLECQSQDLIPQMDGQLAGEPP